MDQRQRLAVNLKAEMQAMERLHFSSNPDLERFSRGGFVVPASASWVYPDVIFPSPQVFQQEGEKKIRALVTHHHDLLWNSPLRALFGNDRRHFEKMVAITADFHVEACGGPRNYTARRGEPHLNIRHLPFTITEADREQWLDLYVGALKQSGFSLESAERYWRWIESLSLRMINRRSRVAPPKRIPFLQIQDLLREEP